VVSELCNAIAETLWTAQSLWMIIIFILFSHIFDVALFMKTTKARYKGGGGWRQPSFPCWESCQYPCLNVQPKWCLKTNKHAI